MREIFTTLVPMLAFMLIPVWIPIVAVLAARIGDVLSALTGRAPERPALVVARETREAARAVRVAAPTTQS